jgi:DNA-binding transcriptional LysR family regulator
VNWEDLRFLLAIRSSGTISGAARELAVDQATVSRRLQALEAALKVRLVDRLPKEARFTKVGADIVERVLEMQSKAFEIQRILTSSRNDRQREIAISAPPVLARHLLAPHLHELSIRLGAPKLTVLSEPHLASLARMEADLALRLTRGTDDGEVVKKVGHMHFALYAHASYPNISKPSDWEFIGYTRRQADFEHKRWLYQTIAKRRIICEVSDLSNQYEAACSGIGVAGLPRFLGDSDPRLVRLSTDEPMLELGIWIALHPDRRKDLLLRDTMNEITELLQLNSLAGGKATEDSRSRGRRAGIRQAH